MNLVILKTTHYMYKYTCTYYMYKYTCTYINTKRLYRVLLQSRRARAGTSDVFPARIAVGRETLDAFTATRNSAENAVVVEAQHRDATGVFEELACVFGGIFSFSDHKFLISIS